MSWPINNTLTIKSDENTFETILNLFADLDNDTTTYEKFCTEDEIKSFDVTRGIEIDVDTDEQSIFFRTNFDPAVPVVVKLATLFPAVTFEYAYEKVDDEEHDMFDIYSGGVLVSREDEIVTWHEEDEEEDE